VHEKVTDVDYEVIVAVNNSQTTGILEMLHTDFTWVHAVDTGGNPGFGAANNKGAQIATGKYLFLLNPDTILINNAVKILFDFIEANPKCGICGGNLFDENRKPTHSYSFLPSIIYELNLCSRGLIGKIMCGKNGDFNYTKTPRKVGYITGADLMIRTDLFHKLNGFDPDFFVYAEETELTYRVKKAGYTVYSVPQAEIVHLCGQSFSGNWERRLTLSLESRRKYYSKTHNSRLIIWICNAILWSSALCKCVICKIVGKTQTYEYHKIILRKL
jgi:GT2 family glycosyltransferase